MGFNSVEQADPMNFGSGFSDADNHASPSPSHESVSPDPLNLPVSSSSNSLPALMPPTSSTLHSLMFLTNQPVVDTISFNQHMNQLGMNPSEVSYDYETMLFHRVELMIIIFYLLSFILTFHNYCYQRLLNRFKTFLVS